MRGILWLSYPWMCSREQLPLFFETFPTIGSLLFFFNFSGDAATPFPFRSAIDVVEGCFILRTYLS